MRTLTAGDRDGAHPPAPVRLHQVTKRYGSIVAVDELSFEIRAGAVTGFLGPNGAGKTTTLRLLLGLARPTAGCATIFGRRYAELEDPLGTVGAVLETSGFHPWRSPRHHLRALAAAAGIPGARVDEVLHSVGLAGAADRRVGGFSLGMRQRLGLAGALLGRPRLLILDEPANGLDPEGIRWLRDFLRAYAADGNSVLISSHLLSEVAQTVDDVVIIARGSTRAQFTLPTRSDLEAVFLELTATSATIGEPA
jgi:ABC-2 type transport system ATP-binding protein